MIHPLHRICQCFGGRGTIFLPGIFRGRCSLDFPTSGCCPHWNGRSHIVATFSYPVRCIPALLYCIRSCRYPSDPCANLQHATRGPELYISDGAEVSSAVCSHDARCCKALRRCPRSHLHGWIHATRASEQTLCDGAEVSSGVCGGICRFAHALVGTVRAGMLTALWVTLL